MVKGLLRALGFLALTIVIGEILKRMLTSGPGRALLGRLGRPELATPEGAEEATKKVKQGIGLVRSLSRKSEKVAAPQEHLSTGPRWVRIVRDAAEMLLGTGALLKAIADFVREDERLRQRLARRRATSSEG